MSFPKKVDNNQLDIVKAFRSMGATVLNLSTVGKGCPDLLIGYKNISVLVEVKSKTGKFTEPQLKFMEQWQGGAVNRIDSVDGAIRLIKLLDIS
jgi:Holliday junction resolvase